MLTLALLLLLGQPTPAAAEASAALRCLPTRDGFLTMRLRGSIEQDVRWTEPALECTGMARPDGKGMRLRFAGVLAGGELAVVFAAPELGRGESARGIPVNVTLIDSAGAHIYGTQGEDRCTFDEIEQAPLSDSALPAHSYRVSARGFCVAPARAVDGDGSVLLTRFDFAGLVSWSEDERATPDKPDEGVIATGGA
jgi:hypothetical protein